jgi:hypothetical protein
MAKNRQDENLHTIEQIKAMGNRVIGPNKGEGGLQTVRGNTVTHWTEREPGLYYPYHAYVRD